MLLSELRKYKGITTLGKKLGKLKCIAIDTKTWGVKSVVLKKILRKPLEYKFDSIKSLNETKKRVIIEGKGETLAETTLEHICCCELMKKKVLASDEKDMGKIYEFVFATEFTPWRVDRLLLHVKPLKRRLRLPLTEVKSIAKNIVLTKPYNEFVAKQ
jgi:sporulation protein YlmC with PRC-barrel domain